MAKEKDRWTDKGIRFMQGLEELSRFKVCVGFQSSGKKRKPEKQKGKKRGKSRDVTNLDVAIWNELGTSNSPARPFMRNSIDNHLDAITACAEKQIRSVTSITSARRALKVMGVMQENLMKCEIEEGDFVENAPSTIRRKRSDRPLIDTGQLRQSIHFVIKPKGGG